MATIDELVTRPTAFRAWLGRNLQREVLPRSTAYCPLACWLQDETGLYLEVISGGVVEFHRDERPDEGFITTHPMPDWMQKFMHRFDNVASRADRFVKGQPNEAETDNILVTRAVFEGLMRQMILP